MDDNKKFELVFQFLTEHGLRACAKSLKEESGLDFDGSELKTGALDEILDLHEESMSQRKGKEQCLLDIVPEGDGVFANSECLSLDDWTGGIGVLCCRLAKDGWLLLACARRVMAFGRLALPVGSSRAALPITMNRHTGGVLGVCQHPTNPSLLLTCSMDKTCQLVDASSMLSGDEDSLRLVQTLTDHSKYVVRARFSSCGKWIATTSYDHSSCVYKAEDETFQHYKHCTQTSFRGAVEALCWHPSEPRFVVSARDDHNLHCFDCSSGQPERVKPLCLNALGDDHISFNALDLSFSPNGKLLAVATDKNRVILMDSSTGQQLANFYGCTNDGFSQPRLCWHPSGHYLYATSQDRCIIVWEVARQRQVARLVGHTGMLRDMYYSADHDVLVTAAMDGVVKLWKYGA